MSCTPCPIEPALHNGILIRYLWKLCHSWDVNFHDAEDAISATILNLVIYSREGKFTHNEIGKMFAFCRTSLRWNLGKVRRLESNARRLRWKVARRGLEQAEVGQEQVDKRELAEHVIHAIRRVASNPRAAEMTIAVALGNRSREEVGACHGVKRANLNLIARETSWKAFCKLEHLRDLF